MCRKENYEVFIDLEKRSDVVTIMLEEKKLNISKKKTKVVVFNFGQETRG